MLQRSWEPLRDKLGTAVGQLRPASLFYIPCIRLCGQALAQIVEAQITRLYP